MEFAKVIRNIEKYPKNSIELYHIYTTVWQEYWQLLLCFLVAETCNDGIQNQGEDGVDCGGPCANCGQ